MKVKIPATSHKIVINLYINPFVKCLQYQKGFVNAQYLSIAIRNATQPELNPKNLHNIRKKQSDQMWLLIQW